MKMRNLILLVAAIGFVFTSCKKEIPEPTNNENYNFTAKIDGNDFKSNATVTLENGILYIEAEKQSITK
jgi:hypothetical protein